MLRIIFGVMRSGLVLILMCCSVVIILWLWHWVILIGVLLIGILVLLNRVCLVWVRRICSGGRLGLLLVVLLFAVMTLMIILVGRMRFGLGEVCC